MFSNLPLDLISLCGSFCSGKDLTALVCTSKNINALLSHPDINEVLWKELYFQHSFGRGKRPRSPFLPNAGSWREVYVRAVAREVCLVIHSLSLEKDYKIVVPREMSLFALKKEIRSLQLAHDGVSLEDFELVDAKSGKSLGCRGNDYLPPSDLGLLFVSNDNIVRSRSATRVIERFLRSELKPAWRKSLALIEDGLELNQVFVNKQGILWLQEQQPQIRIGEENQSEDSEINTIETGVVNVNDRISSSSLRKGDTEFLESMAAGKLKSLVDFLEDEDSKKTGLMYWDKFFELDSLLRRSAETVGYNAHKMFWNGSFNPLIHVALSKQSAVPVSLRIRALSSLVRNYCCELFRGRFYLDVFIQAVIGSGFFMTFSRLIRRLMPLLIRTQVKQIIDAEIDWIPLFFAFKFAIKVIILAIHSVIPVVALSLAHHAIKLSLRTVTNVESKRDDMLVCSLLICLEQFFILRKKLSPVLHKQNKGVLQNSFREFLRTFKSKSTSMKPTFLVRIFVRLMKILLEKVKKRMSIQYALSSLAFSLAERTVDPGLFISLPVYAYALPFCFTMMLVRIRMSISDSYYCVLYL